MSSALLNSAAVARRSGEEAGIILKTYVDTNPFMAHNVSPGNEPAAAAQPKGAGGAVDPTRG